MRRLLNCVAAAPVLALALAAPAAAQDLVIVNATLATGDGSEPIADGVVVIENGKIAFAGSGSDAAEFETDMVIDAGGKWVTPGMVAAVTDLGLVDVGAVDPSNDAGAAKSRFNAALDIATAINPASQHVLVGRARGVTRAVVTGNPGGSIFAGQGAVIDTGADPQPITRARAFQFVTLSEDGARIAGGSRSASQVELRNALREARDFAAGRWDGSDNLLTRADAEALGAVVAGRQKLFVEAHRASDLRAVLALKRDFPALDLVLVGASEGWMVADEIGAAKVPVIAESLQDLPVSFEQLASTQSNIGRMRRAGVIVAVNAATIQNMHHLAQHAGNLVALTSIPGATGLSWGDALAAVTSAPASIAGFGGKLGVLAPGAAGDVVVWDGDPLEVSSAPLQVFIDGVEQPLDNHQSRLRDRYRDLDESDLPKAYDR